MTRPEVTKNLVAVAGLAVVYFVAGKLGLQLAYVQASATAVWPCTGIAIAALLVFGYRVWPGILIGAFVTNLTTAGTIETSLLIAVGNTLEGLAGCYLVSRFAGGKEAFARATDIFKFALLAGGLATTVSATIGVATLAVAGLANWGAFGSIWYTWRRCCYCGGKILGSDGLTRKAPNWRSCFWDFSPRPGWYSESPSTLN
jgi:integral membrane sensor domain MASE1